MSFIHLYIPKNPIAVLAELHLISVWQVVSSIILHVAFEARVRSGEQALDWKSLGLGYYGRGMEFKICRNDIEVIVSSKNLLYLLEPRSAGAL